MRDYSNARSPQTLGVLQRIKEEVRVWIMAGAKHLDNFVNHHRLQF
jgi:hypothetical protein